MVKKAFVEALAKVFNTSNIDAEQKAEAMFGLISDVLGRNGEVTWPGFGRFTVTHKAARMGRNPATGKPLKIAAKAVPTFKAGIALKELVAKKVKAKPKA